DARNLNGLAVDDSGLVLELARTIDRRAVEQTAGRPDDYNVSRRAGAAHRELDDHVALQPPRRGACRIHRGDLHDRQILAVADADAETADFDVRRKLRGGDRDRERRIEVRRARVRHFRLLLRLRRLFRLLLLTL